MHGIINFTSCPADPADPADPDVWMRPAIKSDGTKCYDYVLLYVDDALVVIKNAESILRNELGRYFELKEESIGPPQQKFDIWHTSGCLMVDVPCLDHLWDGRKDPLDVGQVGCSQQETPRKMHHCMLLGLSW